MLRNFLDKIKPNFQKGGKLEIFHSTFDAFETFLYVPNHVTKKGTHIRDSVDMKRTMTVVILALVPCALFGMYNVGYQHFLSVSENADFWQTFFYGFLKVLPMFIVSYVVGLGIEFAFAQMRGHEVNEGYLVSGFLIPLICPPDTPLWMLALAVIFAVIIGKEVFGGTGMNIWNPALIARAFLFFAYPSDMSGEKVWIAEKADAFSGATPMANIAAGQVEQFSAIRETAFMGLIPGSVGETSKLCILIGAAILLFTRIGSLRVMLSVVLGAISMGFIIKLFGSPENPYTQINPMDHLLIGGLLFGAVFMATDPVTAAQTNKGKWIYGFLIGLIAVLVRAFNPAYPEGMMLSILLMNTFAPLIDHFVVQGNINRRLKRLKTVNSTK